MKELSAQYGLNVAMTSMQETIIRKRTEGISVNAALVAARIAGYGLDTESTPGPDMSLYDTLLPTTVDGGMYGPQ